MNVGNLHIAINISVIKGPGSPFYKAILSCSASLASPSAALQYHFMEICCTFGVCTESAHMLENYKTEICY